MNRFTVMHRIRNLTILTVAVACGDSPGDPAAIPPPALETIPFEALGGSGKVAFGRIYWGRPDGGGSGVYIIDAAQKTFMLIPGTVLATDPVISPNGERVAFTAFSSDTFAFDVFAIRLDGSDRVQLTRLDGQDGAPSWTPDGTAVIALANPWATGNPLPAPYVYRQPLAQPRRAEILWTIPYRTSDLDPVPALPRGRVSLSTQGVFAFNTLDRRIYTFTLPDRLTLIHSVQQPREVHGATWSPDGQQIAFLEIGRTGGVITITRVQLISPATGSVTTVVEVPSSSAADAAVGHANLSLCWLGDDRIVFVNAEGGAGTPFSSLYIVRRDGSGLTRITTASAVTDRSVSCSAA